MKTPGGAPVPELPAAWIATPVGAGPHLVRIQLLSISSRRGAHCPAREPGREEDEEG